MGCTQSKIENEEAVTRCRNRKEFMKEAVSSRNAFAAAHSSYAMNVKNTGAALSDFASAEIPSHQLHHAGDVPPAGGPFSGSPVIVPLPGMPPETLPPPPPPLPNFSSSPQPGFAAAPLQRAASMPEMKIQKPEVKPAGPVIMEGDEGAEMEAPENEKLVRRRSSRRGSGSGRGSADPGPPRQQQRRRDEETATGTMRAPMPATTEHVMQHDSTWDYFFPPLESVPGTTLVEPVEEERAAATVEAYRTSKEAAAKRIEKVVEEEEEEADDEEEQEVVVVQEKKKAEKAVEVPVQVPVIPVQETKGLVKKPANTVNLVLLFEKLDDHFLKASQSAHEVSKMLEATRLHYHSNFADNRGHIDHSARVMRVITWNRSFKGLQNVDDGKDDFDSEEHETHATVLDKMLAWEKKLYDEVKVGEQMKYDYQKKVVMLNKQKKKDANPESLEKLKAAVSHLHTRYIVDMQSMDSTVSEINRLRDEQLYPKLVQLVEGMATMWDTMGLHHKEQCKIANELKNWNISRSPVETTDHHHERTYQLAIVVDDWQAEFCKLIDFQRKYIKALHNWLKLNLIPIESSVKEKVSSPPRIHSPLIQSLLMTWDDLMDKLQDDGARSAIKNFAAVMHSIYHYQEEEIKFREKLEDTKRELNRKTRQFDDWYNKNMERLIPDEADPERTGENTQNAIAERRVPVDALKKRLEQEEEDYKKQCLQVRQKSLASLKRNLPELFIAMSSVSETFSEMYEKLRSISSQNYNRS